MTLPIRTRLTLWYGALLAAILLGCGSFLTVRLKADLTAQTDRALALASEEISVDYRATGGESEFRDVTDTSLAGLPRAHSAAQILGRDGQVLEWAGVLGSHTPILHQADIAHVLSGTTITTTADVAGSSSYRIIAIRLPTRTRSTVLVVATSLSEVTLAVRRLVVLLLVAGPLAVAAAVVGGWWLAGRALRPVARMSADAREIGAERLTRRVEVPDAADELRALALTLNGMLDRIAAAMEQQRRFVADASHELRTPLAVMRAELDLSLADGARVDAAETLESAREEVDRMSGIVNDMLVLAQADEGRLELALEPLDLREVASAVAARMTAVAASCEVAVHSAGGSAPALGDRPKLEHVVTNLLDNAVRHSPRGSTLTVRTWRSEGTSGVTVEDQGPGVPPDVLEHVFDRFFRADVAREGDGSGLGLAICKEIVAAHGGRIWATSAPGAGSCFSFSIPTDAVATGRGATDPNATGP